jgi:hypothetical protein
MKSKAATKPGWPSFEVIFTIVVCQAFLANTIFTVFGTTGANPLFIPFIIILGTGITMVVGVLPYFLCLKILRWKTNLAFELAHTLATTFSFTAAVFGGPIALIALFATLFSFWLFWLRFWRRFLPVNPAAESGLDAAGKPIT